MPSPVATSSPPTQSIVFYNESNIDVNLCACKGGGGFYHPDSYVSLSSSAQTIRVGFPVMCEPAFVPAILPPGKSLPLPTSAYNIHAIAAFYIWHESIQLPPLKAPQDQYLVNIEFHYLADHTWQPVGFVAPL
jgi:hypothetical protein